MATLIDTCVLLRAFDSKFSQYRSIRSAFRRALDQDERLIVTVQNIAEFWNVSTRPLGKNGHGLSTERTKRRVGIIERFCEVMPEDNASYRHWKRLIDELGVCGVKVHDARLVSVMLSLGCRQILTLNATDFERYAREGIEVAVPETFLAK